jgi:hypothetical protein
MDYFEPILAVSAVIALVKTVTVLIASSSVATAVVKTVVAVGLSMLAQSLAKKPKLGGSSSSGGSTFMIRQSAYPRRVIAGEQRVGGIWFYGNTTGQKNEFLNLVLGIGEGPINGVLKYYFGDEEVEFDASGNCTTAPYVGSARAFFHDGSQTTGHPELVAEDSNWTANHKLLGIANVYLRLDSKGFESGLPEISFHVEGEKAIYDPRTGTSTYTKNNALWWRHYLVDHRLGPRVPDNGVISEFVETAADICDEAVPILAGGTEPRYEIDGFFLTDQDPEEVATNIVESMAGWQIFVGGKFRVYAGAYTEPNFTIVDDHVVDSMSVRHKLPRAERVNRVKGIYRSPATAWQPTDFTTIKNDDYEQQDGEEHIGDQELPFTISSSRAQRLAKITLERKRRMVRATVPCSMAAFSVQAGENVMFTNTAKSWSSKVFFVDVIQLGVVDEAPALIMTLIENDRHVYDWDADVDETAIQVPPAIDLGAAAFTVVATPPAPGPDVNTAWFRGLGQRLEAPNSTAFDFLNTSDWSMAVWFKDQGSTDNNAVVFARGDAAMGAGSTFAIHTTDAAGAAELSFSIRDSAGTITRSVFGPTPAGQWICAFVVHDGVAGSMKVWAREVGGGATVPLTVGGLVGITSSTKDITVGVDDGDTAEFIGQVGPISIWSDDKTAVTDFMDDYFDSADRVATFKTHSELTATELTNIEHFWAMNQLTGTRSNDVSVGQTMNDTGAVGTGSDRGPLDWPLNVELTSANETAEIYYSVDEADNDINTILGTPYEEDSGGVSVVEGSVLLAKGFDQGVESNLLAGFYGFDYTLLGFGDNVLLWLDASYGAHLDSNGDIEVWNDLSGNDRHAYQTTASLRPQWVADSGNGKAGIRFDGVDEYLRVPQPISGKVDRCFFFVFKSSSVVSAAAQENIIFDLQDGASPASAAMYAIGIESDIRLTVTDDGSHYESYNTGLLNGVYYVLNFVYYQGNAAAAISNNHALRLDNVNRSVKATADVAHDVASTTDSIIGRSLAIASSHFAGDLQELLVIDDNIVFNARDQVSRYLLYKYADV